MQSGQGAQGFPASSPFHRKGWGVGGGGGGVGVGVGGWGWGGGGGGCGSGLGRNRKDQLPVGRKLALYQAHWTKLFPLHPE